MARRNQNADNMPAAEQNDGDKINDGNEENTVETAAAEEARADGKEGADLHEPQGDTEQTLRGEEEGPTGDSYTGGFPKDMESSYDGEKIEVETTGDFQLYDTSTRILIAAEGTTEVPENSQFVQRNIERGKLKKV